MQQLVEGLHFTLECKLKDSRPDLHRVFTSNVFILERSWRRICIISSCEISTRPLGIDNVTVGGRFAISWTGGVCPARRTTCGCTPG